MGIFWNTFIAAFSSLGSFLFGYDSGVIASVITMAPFLDKFNPSSDILGAIVSTFAGGCFFGAAGAGWFNDKFGRRIAIQLGCILAITGCAMQAGANSLGTLIAGRIIGGLAIGVLSMTVPLYNTEIAPPKTRGFMVGLTQQMLGIGVIVANWVGYGSNTLHSDVSWRLPLALQIVPAACLLIGIQFLPNSPRWLIEVGRDEDAREAVHRLHRPSTPEEEKRADEDFATMREQILAELSIRSRSVKDLFATPAMTKRTLVAMGVQVFGQFTGINVINYYGPKIYEGLGLSAGQSLLVQGIYGAVGPIANLFFITLVLDRVGRKKPLVFGAGSFVCTFSVLAAIIASFPPGENANVSGQRAGLAMIFLTSIIFSLSFGPVSWVLASEVFPTSTRSIGTAVATCSNWAFNVMLSQVSPIAMENIGWKFYVIFIVMNFVDCLLILFFFPETKGRSLEEMAVVFGDQIDANVVLQEERAPRHSPAEEKGMVEYAA